jgi:pseudouridylate synthase
MSLDNFIAAVERESKLMMNLYNLSEEVNDAMHRHLPVVALESTVIAHGLPYPQNIETARRLESIIRAQGAVPATIAILEGKVHAGLNADQLNCIGERKTVHKVSCRDLPIAMAKKWDGATTVAATMWIAHKIGIETFATGGIGGVHRGSLTDISADLPELARTPMVVVCSGAKIVLDLPSTREWLETHGVPVIGYGCDEMPAFYSRSSGLPVDIRVDSSEEVAEIAKSRKDLGMTSALLVSVPVPEEMEVAEEDLQQALNTAIEMADRSQISGRELTPFLLSNMSKLSGGRTLSANISLLENNAYVAAEISKLLDRISYT